MDRDLLADDRAHQPAEAASASRAARDGRPPRARARNRDRHRARWRIAFLRFGVVEDDRDVAWPCARHSTPARARCNVRSCPPCVVTRFAPSPTGELHLGSAYSALHRLATRARGRRHGSWCASRISTSAAAGASTRPRSWHDLQWLGLDWDGEVRRQSDHFADYGRVIDRLDARGLVYPCFCTPRRYRRLDQRAASAPRARTVRSIPAPAAISRPRNARARIAAGIEHCMRLDCGARGGSRRGPTPSSTRRWAASRASRC